MTHEMPAGLEADVMVGMFTEAWRTDYSETDGERTYAVHHLRTALEQMGITRGVVGAYCTQACGIVHKELTGEDL
jgi:hypothetical protein